MRDILKYALLAGGAFLAYRQFAAPAQTSVDPTPAPTGTSGGAASTPPPTPVPQTLDLAAVIRAAAGKPGANDRLTFDAWNWYFQQARGIPGPAIEDVLPGTDRGYLMTFDEWRAAVAKKGI